MQNLKNKKILITAGPTWVPIDSVRVISNIATGETGSFLAEEAKKQGAQVSLFLGPANACCLNNSINVIRFNYFSELRNKLIKALRAKRYDIIIHSAAVSDFKLREPIKGKLSSGKTYNLKLVPLPKIILDIRHFAPQARLVMFKLEIGVADKLLIKKAKSAQASSDADVVVANRISPYRAYIISKEGYTITAKNKTELAKKLIKLLVTRY